MNTRLGFRAGRLLTLAVLASVLTAASAHAQGMKGMKMGTMPGRVTVMSKYGYDETVSKLKEAIESQNMMVMFTADHQQMLQMVGVKAPPMLTIEFFAPKYGKQIFEHNGMAAIEVPLRLVVMQGKNGMVMVSYKKPSFVFGKYKGLEAFGNQLDGVMQTIVSSVST